MMWAFGLDELSRFKTIPIVGAIAIVILSVVSLLDRKAQTDPRTRKIMMAGLIVFVSMLAIIGSKIIRKLKLDLKTDNDCCLVTGPILSDR